MESNKEIIERLYTYFKSGEGGKIAKLFSPDIEWKQMEGFPYGGIHKGIDEIFNNVFGRFPMYWDNWNGQAEEFYSDGDKVFVIGHYSGTSIETKKKMKSPFMHVYTLNNGLISHFRQFTDTHVVQKALTND